jgi:hypothetical protein
VVGYFEKLEVSINASVAEHDFKLLDGQWRQHYQQVMFLTLFTPLEGMWWFLKVFG